MANRRPLPLAVIRSSPKQLVHSGVVFHPLLPRVGVHGSRGNKKILADESAYPDHNTVLLIDLPAALAVETAMATTRSLYDVSLPPEAPGLEIMP